MTLSSALIARILDVTFGVQVFVGSRVYTRAVQGLVLPHLRYTRLTQSQSSHLGGLVAMGDTVYQIDSYAAGKVDAETIDAGVRIALGTWQGDQTGGLYVHATALESADGPRYETPDDGSDQGRWTVTRPVRVFHSLSTAA